MFGSKRGRGPVGPCGFCGEPCDDGADHGACEDRFHAELTVFVALVNAAAADDAAAAAALSRREDEWATEHRAWLEDQRAAGWPVEPF